MTDDHVSVKASIRFLSREEGGRNSPLLGGSTYRPNHNFFGPDDRVMLVGSIELPEGQPVAPGSIIQTEMTFWFDPGTNPGIAVGREWRIQEGGKLVALGAIVEVLNPKPE